MSIKIFSSLEKCFLDEDFYDKNKWGLVPMMAEGNVIDKAQLVYDGIDEILAKHGYVREGNIYKAVRPNRETVALFCSTDR